ncbi:MAG TPA: sigma-54-dependent Fis family transcriptional regulator [Nitrospiraceae bacterium]|nr:sigma-54-dependent Fis family transcriptional regulator [Nitrospiraceae bacterium]
MELQRDESPPEGGSLNKQLAEVLAVCQKMMAEREVPALLELIAREGARLMNADRVSIFLLDRERCELLSQVTLDGQSIRLDARLGIAGSCVMTGQLVNVADAQQDQRFYPSVDAQTKFRTRSVLAAPLRSPSGEPLGVVEALNKKRGPFTTNDEKIAQALADQAAIAIETATTLQTLKQRLDKLQAENTQLRKEVEGRFSIQNIIGTSAPIQTIVRLIDQIRDSSVYTLITGESGTGKELVAKAFHYNSPRAKGPFVAINCAALPENLVESELFGIERGVATGVERRIGKFEEAHGGTLFLDEVGDLTLAAQVKLLRVLQERVLERVGGRASIPVDVRVIAATNADLDSAIRAGTFRQDLYFRLKVVEIHMPPLRQVREDIPLLTNYFLRKYSQEMGGSPKRLSAGAQRYLTKYDWPGNVRELENEIRRLVVSVRKTTVGEEDLSDAIRAACHDTASSSTRPGGSLKGAVEELERRFIADALRQSRGNQLQAAKALSLSRQGLIKKMKRYRIKPS